MRHVVMINLFALHSVLVRSLGLLELSWPVVSPLFAVCCLFCCHSLVLKLCSHFCAVNCQEQSEIHLPLSGGGKRFSMSQNR